VKQAAEAFDETAGRASSDIENAADRSNTDDGREATRRPQPLNQQLHSEFNDEPALQPRWVEVYAGGVRVENLRQFDGPWMALHLIRTLQLDTFLQNVMEDVRESVPWDVTSLMLIIARLLEPSSELYISEQWYPKTSLPDLLGVSEDNIEFLRDGGRRYIIGTPKSMLKKFEQDILKGDWHSNRDGLEVKFVMMPASDSEDSQGAATESSPESPECFILRRSRERSKKEEGITQRFDKKIADGLSRMKARCEKQKREPMTVEREIGKLPGKNTRAAKLFDVKVTKTDTGAARIEWSKRRATRRL
jgi:hypothetical protein